MTRYRIRKVGRVWRLFHVHENYAANRFSEHQQADSSHWSMVMWIATGDDSYKQPGFTLVTDWCYR